MSSTHYVAVDATLEVYEPAAYTRLFGMSPRDAARAAIRDRTRDHHRAQRAGKRCVVWCDKGIYYLSIKEPLPAKCQPATLGHGDTTAD